MKSEFINIKKIPKLIIIVTLFFLASLFQLIPIRLFHIDISNITNYQQLLLTTFSDSILLIILVFIYYKDLKKDFKKLKEGNEEGVQQLIHSSKFLSIIAVGILAPIIEELTFRKAFREVFTNKTLFVLASGLIFGGLHVILSLNSLWDLFYIIPYSSLGIAFGYMYQKTDNIYTSIIMHIFHNTALTTLSLIGGAIILL